MMGGKVRARAVLARAPTREMMSPRRAGSMRANPPVGNERLVYIYIHSISCVCVCVHMCIQYVPYVL